MLSPIRPSSRCLRHSIRLVHASVPTQRHLVGPPDPISHLRPVIYDDVPAPTPPTILYHPYSLREFDPEPARNVNAYEMQWKLQRQQIDDMSQNFWLDSNARFEAAKEAVLASLPASATPFDKENALSEFYKQWLLQESERVDEYARLWRARNWANIVLAARVEYSNVGVYTLH
ncbi:hypothetical protein BT96DRAFT_1012636 [Gymnopus androsaceus JB14]|uniref:Apoptogenic protein 1, mitochondrial n=1 Tax=Gymnopus androsaceus JB14 TaxID=1447944 RepID=A0A6A4IKL2_9AGAR|nr:hypothetical protein BT96DRAFT_1012636 [Gymnopus androsaceus JB14]